MTYSYRVEPRAGAEWRRRRGSTDRDSSRPRAAGCSRALSAARRVHQRRPVYFTADRVRTLGRGKEMARVALLALGTLALSSVAWAHHGFGRIDGSQNVTL